MKITDHSSFDFRNIESVHIVPHDEMNIIYGENGQGKTNLIESIWMMTGFYSFRARKNIQLIKKDRDEARIETKFISHGREQNAELKINQKKELILNGVKEESPRALMGSFYAVVFSPVTLGIVQDGPSERRKLLDVALSLMKPNYALIMSKYIRALNQRNNLFKKLGEKSRENRFYFEPWEEELIKLGSKIVKYRLDYTEKLNELASEIYSEVSSGRETFDFYYDFSPENMSIDDIAAKLRANTDRSWESDIRKLYTTSGPHADDLILKINGSDAKIYGSQGQQRSCALALKLAEASMIEKTAGEAPVVLLDDVMSELDEKRQTFILNYLDNRQVFITCCEPSTLLRKEKGKIFEIKNGKAEEIG